MYLFCCCCSVTQLCLTLCYPMDCSTPGLPAPHYLPEFVQIHVLWINDAIQPSHPLSSPSPPALNPSQHQGLFQWVSYSYQMAKVLELQLQHQSFQWLCRVDFLQDWLLWSPWIKPSCPSPQYICFSCIISGIILLFINKGFLIFLSSYLSST